MIKNNKGITLVEVLCVLSLLSIVLLLANSLHIFGQKQLTNQSDHIAHESDIRFAMNLITKDIRGADTTTGSITVTNNVLTVLKNSNSYVYKLVNNNLTKNNNSIITGVQQFIITQNGNQIDLTITSDPAKDGKSITLKTVIYIRG
jgi:prepilin-type N-terminal cleavage/methylation domain-containing protein